MIFYMRASVVLLSLIVGYFGWNTYHYFFDTSAPTVAITGIEHEKCYAGDVRCTVIVNDDYKVADISIFLDETPLVSHFKINKKQDEQLFVIPTTTLTNDKHTLKFIITDSAYKKNRTIKTLLFFVDNQPLQAVFVKNDAEFKSFQGKTVHLQFQVNKMIKHAMIKALSQVFYAVPEAENSSIYECFIPIACEEQPNEYLISVEVTDYVGNTITLDAKLQVIAYPFKQQKLAITHDHIKKEESLGLPERELEEKLKQLVKQSPQKKLWQGTFYAPIDIKQISTEFGTIRTTQHRGRYAHNAVDLLSTPKTVVWATQDGTVIVKDRYVHSGNTVVLDHGCGIFSLFYHLDNFATTIFVGEKIKKGNPIGTLGKTGYATGYHLHWEMRINNIPIDPIQWIKNDF